MKNFLKVLIVIFVISCGGGDKKPSRFLKPQWLASTQSAILIKNQLTKIVYISNYLGGYIIPVDTERNRSIDSDLFNDDLTPIAVAGMLGKIIVKDSSSEEFSFDIYAASAQENAIYLIRAAKEGDSSEEFLAHSFADIGTVDVCSYSKPFFKNEGNSSNPNMGDIQLATGLTKTENWLVKFKAGDNSYSVEGSLSGLQTSMAVENERYTSDNGEISFIVYSGSRETTNKDKFTFGTTCSKPLILTGKPSDFLFSNSKLVAAIYDGAKLELYNEIDLSFDREVALDPAFVPGSLASLGSNVFVSNEAGNTLASVDMNTFNVTYFDIGEPLSYISTKDDMNENLFLIPAASKNLKMFSITDGVVSDSIELSDIPRSFIGISDGAGGEKRGIVSNISNEIDIVDLTNKTRVDQNERSDEESYSSNIKFTDIEPKSDPQLTDVETVDGLTKNERWLLTYNGVVAGTYFEDGETAGPNFTSTSAFFSDSGVVMGDVLVINPFEGNKEEIKILEVIDNTNLVLETTPVNSGSNLKYHIRSDNSFVVFGSISGLQKARVEEGKSYTTDAGAISLSVIPSLNDPTSEGDYFTFLTDDGVEGITLSGKRLPFHMTRVERQSSGIELVYIANEGSDDVSVIEVAKEKEKSTID